MDNIDDLMRTTRRRYGLHMLRWGYVSEQKFCIGFTTNPEKTGMTTTHLADGTQTSLELVPDGTLPDIYWLVVMQKSGIALYQWREPVTNLHDAFVCRSGDPIRQKVCDGYEITRNRFGKRESTLRRLLNTQMPLKLVREIVRVTGTMLAPDAIHTTSTLLAECGSDPVALRQKARQLSRMSNQNAAKAREMFPSLGECNDMQLKMFIRGIMVIADSLA